MGDHTFCLFSSLARIGRNIWKIRQICQNFLSAGVLERTQMMCDNLPRLVSPANPGESRRTVANPMQIVLFFE